MIASGCANRGGKLILCQALCYKEGQETRESLTSLKCESE